MRPEIIRKGKNSKNTEYAMAQKGNLYGIYLKEIHYDNTSPSNYGYKYTLSVKWDEDFNKIEKQFNKKISR